MFVPNSAGTITLTCQAVWPCHLLSYIFLVHTRGEGTIVSCSLYLWLVHCLCLGHLQVGADLPLNWIFWLPVLLPPLASRSLTLTFFISLQRNSPSFLLLILMLEQRKELGEAPWLSCADCEKHNGSLCGSFSQVTQALLIRLDYHARLFRLRHFISQELPFPFGKLASVAFPSVDCLGPLLNVYFAFHYHIMTCFQWRHVGRICTEGGTSTASIPDS